MNKDFRSHFHGSGIFWLRFAHRRDMALALGRMQEFYESPNPAINRSEFDWGEFLHHYTTEDGVFTFLNSWNGYNIPGNVFRQFLDKNGRNLSVIERKILIPIFNEVETSRFYVIASLEKDKHTLNHEIAHAFWYLHADYQGRMRDLLARVTHKVQQRMTKVLLKMGYAPAVVPDEMHAYLSTSTEEFFQERFGIALKDAGRVVNVMRRTFKERTTQEFPEGLPK